MRRKTIISCVLAVLITAYVCVALPYTAGLAAKARMSKKIDVCLSDSLSRFVTVEDVIQELGIDMDTLDQCLIANFDLKALEERLKASDKLQNANVTLLTDGSLHIDVDPMVPVARVFDAGKPSYYINATGKRISAELRYHLDVPVLVGTFDSTYPAKRLLPLLDYIAGNPKVSAMVATVTQERDGNIIIVPTIVGHVVNFGDTSMVADKFARLRAFYRRVLPSKGWDTYDTIAVKWRNRVVATRRDKAMAALPVPTEAEMYGTLDIDDNQPAQGEFNPEIIADQKHTLP